MARSLKKGPYIEAKLETKVLAMTEGKIKKGVIKTWSQKKYNYSGFCRTNFCSTQWKQIYSCLCNRIYGRS